MYSSTPSVRLTMEVPHSQEPLIDWVHAGSPHSIVPPEIRRTTKNTSLTVLQPLEHMLQRRSVKRSCSSQTNVKSKYNPVFSPPQVQHISRNRSFNLSLFDLVLQPHYFWPNTITWFWWFSQWICIRSHFPPLSSLTRTLPYQFEQMCWLPHSWRAGNSCPGSDD